MICRLAAPVKPERSDEGRAFERGVDIGDGTGKGHVGIGSTIAQAEAETLVTREVKACRLSHSG